MSEQKQQQETIFPEGLFFEKAKEGTPDFVKGKLSVNVETFKKFCDKYKKDSGFINLDLLKSKTGKLYLKLNTWEPEKKTGEVEDSLNPSNSPF